MEMPQGRNGTEWVEMVHVATIGRTRLVMAVWAYKFPQLTAGRWVAS
jgi:hypothetical protein